MVVALDAKEGIKRGKVSASLTNIVFRNYFTLFLFRGSSRLGLNMLPMSC